jgi:hypothetical protein
VTSPSAWTRLQRAAEILATDLEAACEPDDRVAISKELRAILLDLKKHAEPTKSSEGEKPAEVSRAAGARNRRTQRRADAAGGHLSSVRGDVG